jgi:hypothetical protein
MAGFSNYWKNQALDHLLASGGYVGLSKADPLADGSGLDEPSGGGYARVQTTSSDWNSAVAGIKNNKNPIIFSKCSSGWGVITYAVLFDSLVGGIMLAYVPLVESVDVVSNDIRIFSANSLVFTVN